VKVTFIKPNIGRREHSLYVDEGRMEPLTLGVLAGLTPEDVECRLFDDRMEAVLYDEATDLVAITVETYTARRAYEIADEYRLRGVPVVMGGMHVSLAPEEAVLHADCLVLGDAETIWAQIVEDARGGKLQARYSASPGVAQMGGTLPRRDLYRGKGYLPLSLMQYSRGCKFGCKFCAVSQYFDRKTYMRRIDEVLREIETLDRRFIFFIDDNIASNRKALKELCHALIGTKVTWVSQASLDSTRDPELMKLMEQSGCWGNVTGFESITEASLRETRKSPNLGKFCNFEHEVAVLRDHGMQTWAAFALGFDNDTLDSIRATVDFALQSKFTFAAFNILMPYPGTPLYKRFVEEDRHLYDGKWWLHPEYRFNNCAFKPALMTAQELTDACHSARKRFNSPLSLLHRFSDLKTNMRSLGRAMTYWYYTLIFRKEVYKKHGMRFGLR
jgi:radical SAM superfamily enzyme YgiQ (UPF0313 family)